MHIYLRFVKTRNKSEKIMNIAELNMGNDNYIIKSGHNGCHPETCQCWNFRVYNKQGHNVFNSDSPNSIKNFCSSNIGLTTGKKMLELGEPSVARFKGNHNIATKGGSVIGYEPDPVETIQPLRVRTDLPEEELKPLVDEFKKQWSKVSPNNDHEDVITKAWLEFEKFGNVTDNAKDLLRVVTELHEKR